MLLVDYNFFAESCEKACFIFLTYNETLTRTCMLIKLSNLLKNVYNIVCDDCTYEVAEYYFEI